MAPRSLVIRFLLPAIVLVGTQLPAWAITRYVNPSGGCGGNLPCTSSLQAAIAAAANGDVIVVQPGLYNTATRDDVDREVRILGPGAFTTPLPSMGSTRVPGDPLTEAILDGGGALATIIRVLADNVELSGLEVRNGTDDLIDSPAGTAIRNSIVRNNIIHGSTGDEGVQLRNDAGALIECNHVYDTAGDAINLCCGSTDGVIQFNEVHDIASPDAALYVYDSSNTRIEGNLVYVTTGNEGIKLGAKNGSDAAGNGGAILNNRVHDTRQDGIAVYTSNTTVRCNEIYASTSENGAIYLAFAISNVGVTDNHVHDNTLDTAKWGDPGAIMIGTAVEVATVTVSGNRIAGNTPNGVTNKATAVLVAENNWWGAASGPGPAGPGTGDRVSINVDYDPWLPAAPGPSCPAIRACTPDLTPVRATTWGQIKLLYR